ncbi:MAG TPA: YihY/virulence factor BrkB family protein [Methylococcaceae bacterium]|nr:YihY/virulence factor BrkB family protein [Methylococcaceae bacterium]
MRRKHFASTIRAIREHCQGLRHAPAVGGALRWLRVLLREMREDHLELHAMSLVYTTLLSLVPLLAVSFSVLKSFGVHNQLQPFLLEILRPLGAQGSEIAADIVGFVERMDVSVLGALGIAMLFYTVGSLLGKIEAAFNHIWHTRSSRSFARRFSDYLSVVTVGPVLVFSAIGIMASLAASETVQALVAREVFGTLYLILGIVTPYVLIVAAFTFLYLFLPNTRVAFRSALAGGACAGLAWKGLGWLFAEFVADSTQYNAVYSSLAILILFMMWLYSSWLVTLLGGRVAFLHQYPAYLAFASRYPALSCRQEEWAGFAMILLIGQRFLHGDPPWTLEGLCRHLQLPIDPARELLRRFCSHGLLVRLDDGKESYLPARHLAAVAARDVYQAIRGEPAFPQRLPSEPTAVAAQLCNTLDAAGLEVIGERSLLELMRDQ